MRAEEAAAEAEAAGQPGRAQPQPPPAKRQKPLAEAEPGAEVAAKWASQLAPAYGVGERVVYTPSTGDGKLATVRFVGLVGGKQLVGIELDEDGLLYHDGLHVVSGKRHFTCSEGRGCYVMASSGRLRSAMRTSTSQELKVQRKLLHGLEAMSESRAQCIARRGKLAKKSLRLSEGVIGLDAHRDSAGGDAQQYVPVEEAEPEDKLERCPSVCPAPSPRSMSEGPAPYQGPLLPRLHEGHLSMNEAHSVFEHCRQRWQQPLPAALLLGLVKSVTSLLLEEPLVLRLCTPPSGRLIVIGDTHGHLKDLVHIWRQEKPPSLSNVYLFNGDICDRGDSPTRGGQQALHIWACVLSFKLACPGCVFINRGNHEDASYWPQYGASGFIGEIDSKYARKEAGELARAFSSLCKSLPIAAVVDRRCVVLHGGVPRCWAGEGNASLRELEALRRPLEIPDAANTREEQLLYDVTWADPQEDSGVGPGARGGDHVTFGPDLTLRLLRAEGLQLLIRSHEVPGRQKEYRGRGYEWWHPVSTISKAKAAAKEVEPLSKDQKGWCLTVFSASDYCGCLDNAASRVVFSGSGGSFNIVEHSGIEAERSLLSPGAALTQSAAAASAAISEQACLSFGYLHRKLAKEIVKHKPQLLAEFTAMDRQHDWFLRTENWAACCRRVLPLIPWEDYADDSRLVPKQAGRVCYTLFLTRYQVRFRNKLGLHSGFRRRLAEQLFEGLLRADYTLRDMLRVLDADGDGSISAEEFASALARIGKVLTASQARELHRLTVVPSGTIKVEDFLGSISLYFKLANPSLTTLETAFVPARLDAICKDLLDLAGGPSASGSQSVAVILRRFFERADRDQNGYLEPDELVAALQPLRSCADLSKAQLEAVARYIDFDQNGHINYTELLSALCVRHADAPVGMCPGPRELVEDVHESVNRIMFFEYLRTLRTLLRRLFPPGCTRCTPSDFEKALAALNSSDGGELLSMAQIKSLVETLDVDVQGEEAEGHFDFEDYFESYAIVDTFGDDDDAQYG